MTSETSSAATSVGSVRSSSNILATLTALKRRSIRDGLGLFRVEGPRGCLAAESANWTINAIIYNRQLATWSVVRKFVERSRTADIPVVGVSPKAFRQLSIMSRASGVATVVRQRWTPLAELLLTPTDHVLVLDHIRSCGNLGTILRTAEAVGTRAVIFVGTDIDPFDPAVIRASMGGVFGVPLVRSSVAKLNRWRSEHGVRMVGLSPDGRPAAECSFGSSRPIALCIGAERSGLSESLCSLCEATVSLPMTASVDSLNVAVATGVMLYEIRRHTPLVE